MQEHITVIGNIASVPERRQTSRGDVIASFRLATNDRRFDEATNSWVDGVTNFYDVSAFRSLGEHALASLQRGQRIVVTGRFRLREWEAQGKRGVAAEIVADGLGPDLRFGTATFARRIGGSSGGAEAAPDAGGSTAHDASTDRDGGYAAVGTTPEPALATAWAAPGSAPSGGGADDDTPY
jgi:single-strand DNA-binding protein